LNENNGFSVKRQRNSSLTFIFITLLIDVLGIGLLIPILPEFIQQISHKTASAGSLDYGRLLAIYGAMQFLCSPLMGTLSDRYGRRPILLLSMLFTGADYVIMALAPNLIWLYIGRILSGITGASMTAASAYIADVSAPEERAQNFGIVGAAFGLGFILGPALGGFLGQYGTRVPFWAAAFLCFANFVYGYFILPESLKPENRRAFKWSEANPIGALKVIGRYPVVWGLTGSLVASNLAMQCMNSTWVLFTQASFGWNTKEVGMSLAAFGVIALVYQLGLARILLPKWGEKRTMIIGLTFGIVEFIAYAFATQGWMIYAIMILGGLALLSMQATQGLLSRQVGEDEQGTLQGALTSLASLTGIFGPLIGTELFSHFTRSSAPIHMPGISFVLAAILNSIALVIAIRVLSRSTLPGGPGGKGDGNGSGEVGSHGVIAHELPPVKVSH
jgi:DHA1 family tetracycline resistance protein-like MFS transporter